MAESTPVAVGVDVGGTFTDIVAFTADRIVTWKVPTSSPQSQAVVEAMQRAGISEETMFLHGTTVATNALLEGTETKVALVTSPGFEDMVEIARQKRPSLYDQAMDRPVPLVDRSRRIGHVSIDSTIELLAGLELDVIALSLLYSYADPALELELASRLREAFPDIPMSVGVEVSPEFREYERTETTVINAYLTPVVSGYLRELSRGVETRRSFVMTSSGGLLSFPVAVEKVGQLTLSGPAAGVVAANALRAAHGLESVIAFDMGGTSTDVCRIGTDGFPLSPSQDVGGRPNRVPSAPIHTVGAGGGSIAWRDEGGSLRVGPRSAGSTPGPASYGRGGTEPTVTDANVFLGYIPGALGLGGGLDVDHEAARRSIESLAAEMEMAPEQLAAGIIEVSDSHVTRAIRVVSIEEGFDPRQSTLIAYGGAGGLHAGRIGRALEMRSVMVPSNAGVFSALGLLLARPSTELAETLLEPITSPRVAGTISRLSDEATAAHVASYGESPASVEARVDCRYLGQSHELTIGVSAVGALSEKFASAHQQRFGFVMDGVTIEVVNVRAAAYGDAPASYPQIHARSSEGPTRVVSSQVRFDSEPIESLVYERSSLSYGFAVAGPAVIVDDLSTILVSPEETARVLEDGTLEVTW